MSNSLLNLENVVYRKVKDISIMRSRWPGTFVTDLKPNEKLDKNTGDVARITSGIISRILQSYEERQFCVVQWTKQ